MINNKRRSVLEHLERRNLLAADVSSLPGLSFQNPELFSPAIPTNDQITASAYVDLNRDGEKDLVLGTTKTNGFLVAMSIGNGRFSEDLEKFDLPEFVHELIADDINDDGVIDILARSEAKVYSVVGSLADNVWNGSELKQTIEGNVKSITIGDINGDDILDLIRGNDNAIVYVGVGDGTFANPIAFGPAAGVIKVDLHDMDGDQDLDLVVAEPSRVVVLRNDGGIFETEIDAVPIEENTRAFSIEDVNTDGIPDLWVGQGDSHHAFVSFHLGRNDNTFEPHGTHYEILGPPRDIKFSDVNADGALDVVVGHDETFHHPVNGNGPGGISVVLARPDGGFAPAIRITTPNATRVYADDVNDDGRVDLLGTHWSHVSVFTQEVDAKLGQTAKAFEFPDSNVTYSAAGHLNDDSIGDFAVVTYNSLSEDGTLEVLLGQPDGTYLTKSRPIPNSPQSVFIANFDGDSEMEIGITTTDFRRSEFSVWELNENGEISDPIVSRLSESWNLLVTLDTNGDNIADFLARKQDASVHVLQGSEDGRLLTRDLIVREAGYLPPAIEDLNGDDINDLIFQTSGGFESFLGNGKGEYRSVYKKRYQFGEFRLGDVDGDRHQDLVYSSFNDQQIHVAYGQGDGTFANERDFDKVNNATFFVADVNGDELADVLFDSYMSFEVHISDGQTFQPWHSAAIPHSIGEVRRQDIDGDGDSEVLLVPRIRHLCSPSSDQRDQSQSA